MEKCLQDNTKNSYTTRHPVTSRAAHTRTEEHTKAIGEQPIYTGERLVSRLVVIQYICKCVSIYRGLLKNLRDQQEFKDNIK
jgi:hypothetical protein